MLHAHEAAREASGAHCRAMFQDLRGTKPLHAQHTGEGMRLSLSVGACGQKLSVPRGPVHGLRSVRERVYRPLAPKMLFARNDGARKTLPRGAGTHAEHANNIKAHTHTHTHSLVHVLRREIVAVHASHSTRSGCKHEVLHVLARHHVEQVERSPLLSAVLKAQDAHTHLGANRADNLLNPVCDFVAWQPLRCQSSNVYEAKVAFVAKFAEEAIVCDLGDQALPLLAHLEVTPRMEGGAWQCAASGCGGVVQRDGRSALHRHLRLESQHGCQRRDDQQRHR